MSDSPELHCVILAAGASLRLRPMTDGMPKCLLPVAGKSTLERTIDALRVAGVMKIAVVAGFQHKKIREFLSEKYPGVRFRLVYNPNFETTNNAYSLLLTRRVFEDADGRITGRLLLLDSDILFPPAMVSFFLASPADDAIAVRRAGEHDGEEVGVVVDGAGLIRRIGKGITKNDSYGESIGIERFSEENAAVLFRTLEERIRNGGRMEYYESSFQQMIDEGCRFSAVDVSAYPSMEIDTPDDYRAAEQLLAASDGSFDAAASAANE